MTLCLEPLTTKETDFCNSCAEAVELMKLVDHPHFVLHQDVKAMLAESRKRARLRRPCRPCRAGVPGGSQSVEITTTVPKANGTCGARAR